MAACTSKSSSNQKQPSSVTPAKNFIRTMGTRERGRWPPLVRLRIPGGAGERRRLYPGAPLPAGWTVPDEVGEAKGGLQAEPWLASECQATEREGEGRENERP